MVANWDEAANSASAGFSIEGGRAQMTLYFTSYPYTEVTTILGKTTTYGDGRLQRTRPVAHPTYPWLVAERISNIQGLGAPVKTATAAALFADQVNLAYYAGYTTYAVTIEFTPRPYALLPDSSITSTLTDWKGENGTTSGESFSNKFTTEYLRYTDYEVIPDLDVVTAQHGQMVFRSTASPPNGVTFTGMPRVYIPKAVVKFRWYQVPYSYIDHTDSLILRYLGYINQTSFRTGSRLWPAGSLLYRGVMVKRYTPPIPDTAIIGGTTVYSPEKLCDLEFIWEFTKRDNASPTSPAPGAHRIMEGHNCMPWYGNRKYYYVTVNDSTAANQYPTYPSVPFQLLFTDPANAS
jgi:hypothetical protein